MQTSHRTNADATAPAPPSGQAWLSSAGWDCLWIISPAFVSAGCVLLFRQQIAASQTLPLWVWVCFVLLIDVAHVYGTLFRTYFDPKAFAKNKTILLAVPVVAWIGGSLLYSLDELFFWRTLAYLAVFHFIRQQFGFMVLYSRKDPPAVKKFQWLDCAAVYMATIYPLLYWHTHVRNFSWFVAGDFFDSWPEAFCQAGFIAYVCVAVAYCIKEILMAKQVGFNIAKNLLLAGTALSWYVGIIAVNSDFAFTVTNVVSHGVPYMALIWLYHKQKAPGGVMSSAFWGIGWKRLLISNALIFVAFLGLLAYLEEGFWDGLVWREHLSVFAPFAFLPHIADGALLALLVPFLALPQSTHYLLDGFIWRVKERNNIWSA
jgi:hypothetical protein